MNALKNGKDEVLSFDGTRLSYHVWGAKGKDSDKLVVVLHGIGFHGKPYKIVAQSLNCYNIPVYAFDTRGHGQSDGERGMLASPNTLIQDVKHIISFVHSVYPGKKIFLLGDSMGGSIALAYAAKNQDSISGLILIAPGLRLSAEVLFRFETLKALFWILMNKDRRTISLINDNLEASSRLQEFVDFRRKDHLSLDKVSISYLLTLNSLNSNWKCRYATKIKIPTLILHGGNDNIINPRTSQKLYDTLETSDKKIVILPDAFHTLFWDVETPRVFEEIAAWLKVR